MKTIVHLLLCPGATDEAIAEIRMDDPRTIPNIFDIIQFDPERDGTDGDLCGRVTSRVFRQLPFHTEIEVIAEPFN